MATARTRSNLVPAEVIQAQAFGQDSFLVASHVGYNISSTKTKISRLDHEAILSRLRRAWGRMEESAREKGTYEPRSVSAANMTSTILLTAGTGAGEVLNTGSRSAVIPVLRGQRLVDPSFCS